MKNTILILASAMVLGLSSCKDSEEPFAANEPAPMQNSVTVTGQSAKSVLTLGFLMANTSNIGAHLPDVPYNTF